MYRSSDFFASPSHFLISFASPSYPRFKFNATDKRETLGSIHKGCLATGGGGERMHVHVLILSVKSKILRTLGKGGNKNGKILQTSLCMPPY